MRLGHTRIFTGVLVSFLPVSRVNPVAGIFVLVVHVLPYATRVTVQIDILWA